jgi:hypothetical protein
MRKLTGQADDPRSLKVRIIDRKVNARCHNGWRFVTAAKSTPLNEPNKSGLYTSD